MRYNQGQGMRQIKTLRQGVTDREAQEAIKSLRQ